MRWHLSAHVRPCVPWIFSFAFCFFPAERNADLPIMSSQQRGLTMRVCGHLVSIPKMLAGNTPLVAESVSQTWNTSRASPLTLASTKTPGNTGTLETPLSRTSGNTPTFKESERGSVRQGPSGRGIQSALMTARGERVTHQTHCVFLNPRLYNMLLQTRYTKYIYLLTVDHLLTAQLRVL